jgi:hypothetical protein
MGFPFESGTTAMLSGKATKFGGPALAGGMYACCLSFPVEQPTSDARAAAARTTAISFFIGL